MTERLDPHGARFVIIIRQIRSALENHIRLEEDDIFPRIAKAWDQSRLEEAGEEMSGMKVDEAGPH